MAQQEVQVQGQDVAGQQPGGAGAGTTSQLTHPAAARVHAMLQRGEASPAELAAVTLANPAARLEIIGLLHALLGNRVVQAVIDMMADHADHDGGAAEATLGPVRIVARRLRVRATPTTKSFDNIVGGLPRGAVVTALAKEDAWYQIEYEGKKAYIHSGYAAPVDKPTTKKPPAIAEDEGEAEDREEAAAPSGTSLPAPATAPASAVAENPFAGASGTAHGHVGAGNPFAGASATAHGHVGAGNPFAGASATAHGNVSAGTTGTTSAPPTATTTAPTAAPTPTSDDLPANGPRELFKKVYAAGSDKVGFQQAQVFVSPGGVTAKPDIFLFFHGHKAQLEIDDKVKGEGNLSGIDVAEQAMAQARGKNTIAIVPQGVFGGSGHGKRHKEGGYMRGLQAGLPTFLESILGPLAADLGVAALSPGHISIAGHSAGGYMGVHDALSMAGDLADNITDVTLMDTSYSDKHFKDTTKWMFAGSPGKSVRIIGTKHQIRNAERSRPMWASFKAGTLAAVGQPLGYTVDDVGDVGDERGEHMRVVQHSRVMKDGQIQADVLILEYDKTGSAVRDHHPLRDEVMDDAVLSIGEGAAGNTHFGERERGVMKDDASESAAVTPAAPAAEHAAAEHAPVETKPTPKPAPPKKKPPKQDEEANPFAQASGPVDAYGNLTKRVNDRSTNKVGDQTFTNSFTVVRDGKLYTKGGKKTGEKLAVGTRVWVGDMSSSRVQVRTDAIGLEDNLWIDFASLGGKGADVGLGNEHTDPEDKARADKIREGLPAGRNPGQSKFTWGFSSKFQPSLDGVALDGSLMSKVHALMEWAIHNDMVLGDIKIGSGMRSPKSAHYLCVRYELANMDRLNHITMANLKALPGGRDEDGNKWYEAGWTDKEAIEYAREKIRKAGAKGKPAAAGYNLGDSRRLPLPLSGKPGVSRHCSGHAVDVDIPWRSEKDPNKKDVWAWEHIYHQFGLTRPLHRSVSNAKDEESWHIEETGKALAVEGEAMEDED